MRLAWYAGASTALAATVVTSAFYQRANFYSAMVYLSQSNLCLIILVNLIFLIYGSCMYGLQRLCFGQLRPVEIEQLYEKAWFAVTETCLAMTVFREEVGAFFLIMFTALVTGKVWGWIAEGRVEILEQQPPANPRLFHTRLTVSLLTSIIYNIWLLHFSVHTVVQQARPNMMVMFLFEFAILSICSIHTALRYILSLVEASVVKTQTKQRLEQRRNDIRTRRAEIERRREAGEDVGIEAEELPNEEDVDEMDIEVPGWEAKGQWILSLDLVSDFMKLGIYAAFFFVLLRFYGLPIHIMRDLFMTTRSFIKRLGALLRYRQALRDMNNYPDATEEELAREDTCIICREEMRPWDPAAGQVERSRPKKLPCGHILHFGCLKSWLERQQACPTCRRPVVVTNPPGARNRDAMVFRLGLNFPNGQNQAAPVNGAAPGGQPPQNDQHAQGRQQGGGNNGGVRMFNIGPFRLGFAQGGVREIQDMAQRMGIAPDVANNMQPPAPNPQPQQTAPPDLSSMEAVRARLGEVDQRIQQEVRSIQGAQQELHVMHLLLQELERLRQQNNPQLAGQTAIPTSGVVPVQPPPPTPLRGQLPFAPPVAPFPQGVAYPFAPRFPTPAVTRHGGAPYSAAIPSGSAELPEGVVIPPGWSLLPLQRLDGGAVGPGTALPIQAPASVQVQIPDVLHAAAQHQPPQPRDAPVGNALGQTPIPSSETNGATSAGQSQPDPSSSATPGQGGTHQEMPPVAAPTPVMPNWGGPAQIFGNGGGMPFGLQAVQPSRPAEVHNGTSTPAANSGQSNGEAVGSAGSNNNENENGGSSAVAKGKAPAVTVEDAEDESE